jgi:hypothetical protein
VTPALPAKLALSTAATAAFVLVFAVVYVLHARYLPVDVVLYAALADALVAAVLTAALAALTPLRAALSGFERLLLFAVWLLGGALLAFAGPTLIDRSFSFYILEKIQQRGGGVALDRVDEVIVGEFIREHRLMDVRLTEQLESGTLVIEDGCVVLTPRGQRLAGFARAFRRHVLPRRRLLMGTYSDDLTDPFRASEPGIDPRCAPASGLQQRGSG